MPLGCLRSRLARAFSTISTIKQKRSQRVGGQSRSTVQIKGPPKVIIPHPSFNMFLRNVASLLSVSVSVSLYANAQL
jgi:hypothetical protein